MTPSSSSARRSSSATLLGMRQQIPGFGAIENELIGWLHSRFGTVVEPYAHGRMD